MTGVSSLRRKVAAGEIIRPWLILGPFYQDLRSTVVGAAADYRGSTATHGCGAMAKVIADAADILGSTPREAQEAEFRALRGRWQLVRQPAPYFSWGRYFYTNHVTAAFLSTLVTAEDPGTRRWRLLTHVTGRPSRVVISLNQELIYDSGAHSAGAALEQGEHHFRAVLRPGENVLNVGMFRIANFAQAGCRLEVTDGDMEAWIPLAQSMPLASRLRMETELSSVRLPRDLLYPEHEVIVYLGLAPASPVRVRLLSSAGEALREVMASEPGPASLGPAGELADGPYQIECAWLDSAGAPVTSVAHSVEKVTLAPHLPGEKHQEERRRIALTCATSAGRTIGSNQRPNIWAQVAYYAEGRYDRIDERTIRDTCAFIAERRDCSEFVLAGLLRLMYFDQAERRLSPEIRALMKDTVLGFKYWLDEPGDTLMCMITENHAFRFHVDEWLAGQLFPDEEFANSHQRGLFHILKGRTYLTEWLRRKGRFGLSEWHSNHYLPTNFPSLVNVFDFARKGEDDLREMARAVLDYLCFILATDTFEGVFGTPHFRCYGRDLKHPEVEGTSPTCWLLYGTGSLVEGIIDDAVVALATSRYRPPGILSLMAADRQAVVHSRIRQALGVPWSDEVSAYYCVYRTPDYMIAGLQDFRKGGFGAGIHVAQVTLPGKAVIFWSCPHTSEEGPGLRPDYWSGNASMAQENA